MPKITIHSNQRRGWCLSARCKHARCQVSLLGVCYHTLTENAKQCRSVRKSKTQKIPDAIFAVRRRTVLTVHL